MKMLQKTLAIALFISCIFCTIAILDYHPEDPSYFHATDKAVSNVASKYGAWIADPIIQAFGYGIIIPLIVLGVFCVMTILEKKIELVIMKVSFLILSLPAFCFILAFFDANEIADGDYYSFHLSGYLGYYLHTEAMFSEKLSLYSAAAIIVSLLTLAFALGIVEKINHMLVQLLQHFNWSTVFSRRSQQKAVNEAIMKDNPEIKFTEKLQQKAFDISSELIEPLKQSSAVSEKPMLDAQSQAESKHHKTSINSYENIISALPSSSVLKDKQNDGLQASQEELAHNKQKLLTILNDFGIRGEITEVFCGPVVTLYCLEPVAGTKSSRVIGLADDIARSMSVKSARISVVSGKNAIGIEIPNIVRHQITIKEILQSDAYKQAEYQLPLALGKNITGEIVVVDLAKMPHLLVAGTTGSGKSVAIHAMILSLLFKYTAEECKFIMIDPKMLELSIYSGVPHLLAPVVTSPEKAVETMQWIVSEMSSRYRAMSILGARNITSYNNIVKEAKSRNANIEKQVQTGFDSETRQPIFESIVISNEILPYIVVIIDEMADLMLTAGKEVENSVQRLAQMARAAGIHLIMATQRPSVDIITGVIKANFPTRISFQVVSRFDSRTILGEIGAEQLLGAGDMLYMMPGGKVERIHGTYVDETEIEAVVNMIKKRQ